MPNNRIFYACQAVGIAKTGETLRTLADTAFRMMQGVQSVGINTNFTLEQVFELGQVELYANEEDIADIEVTIEKVIDGKPLLYLQAVGNIGKTNVVSASNSRCDVYLAVYDDSSSSISGLAAGSVLMCSGMYVSSVSYTYPVDGQATESITLVGNDKYWNDGFGVLGGANAIKTLFGMSTPATAGDTSPINNLDSADDTATGVRTGFAPGSGVVRRARVDIAGSTIPAEVGLQQNAVGTRGIQSITVNADFGRENQLELGRFGPYNKYATYPFEVTCEFEVNAVSGDLISVSGTNRNLTNRSIVIKDLAGTVIDLGTKNKLSSVAYTGGDTGGGVATVTYSYSTYNSFTVNGGGLYW